MFRNISISGGGIRNRRGLKTWSPGREAMWGCMC